MRQDLDPGVAVAQTVHAAGETGPAVSGTYAVALAARDEGHLLRVAVDLLRAQVPFKMIRESDGQAMAIGIAPCTPSRAMRRCLSQLPLWR